MDIHNQLTIPVLSMGLKNYAFYRKVLIINLLVCLQQGFQEIWEGMSFSGGKRRAPSSGALTLMAITHRPSCGQGAQSFAAVNGASGRIGLMSTTAE
jgi:hypothetical protein